MTLTIDTPADFDYHECINSHGWRQLAPFNWDAESGTLERVEEFAPGNVSLLSVRSVAGAITVDVTGEAPETEVAARIDRIFQLGVSIERFHAYCAGRKELAHIPAMRQGRMLTSPTLFEDVLKVIATTNTTWSQTKGMVARIVDAYGSPLPGDPARHAFPRPEQIAAASLEDFTARARLGYRNEAVHRIATDIAAGSLDLESWRDPSIPSPDLTKRLLSLPGVGPYAASCLMIYLGRYDRVNVDSWARMMVGKELGRPVTDKEVHTFFAQYGEWQGLVYHFYKWRVAEPAY